MISKDLSVNIFMCYSHLMEKINVSEFKAICLSLVERVKRGGAGVLIYKNGEPAAMLVAPTAEHGKIKLGALTGEFSISSDIVSPVLPASAWESLKK